MTGHRPAVLAVDGGNSKTDVALIGTDGALLGLVRGPGMPGKVSDQTVTVIGDLVGRVVKEAAAAGRPMPDGTGPVASQLVACVANADLEAEERQLEEMLAARGWAASTHVANDTFAVLRAGLDDVPAAGAGRHWGTAVTCGAGINCVALAPDGRTTRFLALGTISGDWGGGGGLGFDALWWAARAADGRGPATTLRDIVPAHFGLATPDDVAIAIHQGEVGYDEIGGLAPLVFTAAEAGDQVSIGIVARLADEVFKMIKSACDRLGLTGPARTSSVAEQVLPVVLGGGVIAGAGPILTERIADLITAEVPVAEITVVTAAPVAGAALMGLDLAGAELTAMVAVREAFALRRSAAGQLCDRPHP